MGASLIPIRDHVRDLFFDAIEVQIPERRLFLDRICHDLPPEARHELLALLKAYDSAGDFLSEPTVEDSGPSALQSPKTECGTTIGAYRLMSVLGAGGFGTVYLAEQTTPVRRQVALKVIKPGMDTEQVIQRFGNERQAVARMNHPNIARVFDAGTTDTKRPWFAMELVEGRPIIAYARDAGLSLVQKLRLFVDVCKGVAHAHQRGVIHRDIKPANILVAVHDGKPVPKIIDFGIAKALDPGPTDMTQTSDSLRGLGTPQYMSPEQAGGSGEIDVRTDIYALGVVLYEMLTGLPPIDPRLWQSKAQWEKLHLVQEMNLPKPSRRLETADVADPPLSTRRRTSRLLRGELDSLIAQATQKDPDARYRSVNDLVDDVENYLACKPIRARSPSWGYTARKFLRRRRGPVATVAAVLLGVVVSGSIAVRAHLQTRAERAERIRHQEVAALNLRLADERAGQAAAARTYGAEQSALVRAAQAAMQHMFVPLRNESPEQMQASIERLDAFADRIDRQIVEAPPRLRAAMESVLAFSYHIYKRHDKAETRARHAVQLLRELGPDARGELGVNLSTLAAAVAALGRVDETEAIFNEVVEIYRSMDHPVARARIPGAMVSLAIAKLNSGDLESAVDTFESAIVEAAGMTSPHIRRREWYNTFARRLEKLGHHELAGTYREWRDSLPDDSAPEQSPATAQP